MSREEALLKLLLQARLVLRENALFRYSDMIREGLGLLGYKIADRNSIDNPGLEETVILKWPQ
jgi:cysteinyl-tRNA synthetase